MKLVVDLVARAACARPLGTPALDHEVFDDPVEDESVVVALLRQLDEIGRGLRGPRLEEFHLEGAQIGIEMNRSVRH